MSVDTPPGPPHGRGAPHPPVAGLDVGQSDRADGAVERRTARGLVGCGMAAVLLFLAAALLSLVLVRPEAGTDWEAEHAAADGAEPEREEPDQEPVELEGTGDDTVELDQPFAGLGIAHITHDGDNVRVTAYPPDADPDPDAFDFHILANRDGAFDGRVLVNDASFEETATLEVEADGAWTVALLPLAEALEWSREETTGTGPEVLRLDQPTDAPTVMTASHAGSDAESNYFSVHAGPLGNHENDLAHNSSVTTYEGEGLVRDRAELVVVDAVGEWALDLRPFDEATEWSGEEITGTGTAVLRLTGEAQDGGVVAATHSGPPDGLEAFRVYAGPVDSPLRDYVHETQDTEYSGEGELGAAAEVVLVSATGEWSLELG